jgi:chlorobactene glucosyltransferase
MSVIIIFITLTLISMAGIAIVNTFTFPRLRSTSLPRELPQVSILLPARNEAAVIGQTVQRLLAQTYPDFEIIVLDDNSEDETAAIALSAAQGDLRLRLISGQPLPADWLGKNWACQQLGQAARSEWLIFTDADVRWSPQALAALVGEMSRTQADLLTIWPTQYTYSWGERLVVPLMALVVLAYLPLPLVHHSPWLLFAAANGQCLAFRRRAYQAIGEHAALKANVLEDVNFARRIKANGFRLRMADGAGLISCRMYEDWPAVRAGYAKNILAGYGNSLLFLSAATLFHWLIFLAPWVWLIFGLSINNEQLAIINEKLLMGLWPLGPMTLIGLGVLIRMLTAVVSRQRPWDALLMPISVGLMTRIAAQAVWWHWHGGPRWKGRVIRREV